jgi:Ras-related protein Rab-5C
MGCGNSKKDKQGDTGLNWSSSGQRPQGPKNNFKVVFLGKSGVGKTSITLRFCRDTFTEGAEATIGASFLTKMMNVGDRTIKFEMWDTAGQERYRALAPMYYRNADAAVLVYDITDPDSFDALLSWYQELQKNVPDCIIFLAGNKLDLKDKRKVSLQQAQEFAKEKDCTLREVSSKTGENIQDLFAALGAALTQKFPEKR